MIPSRIFDSQTYHVEDIAPAAAKSRRRENIAPSRTSLLTKPESGPGLRLTSRRRVVECNTGGPHESRYFRELPRRQDWTASPRSRAAPRATSSGPAHFLWEERFTSRSHPHAQGQGQAPGHRRRRLQGGLVRVVFDTNVLVAAFAADGLCAKLLRRANRRDSLVLCPVIFEELERVLKMKIRATAGEIRNAIDLLAEISTVAGKIQRPRRPPPRPGPGRRPHPGLRRGRAGGDPGHRRQGPSRDRPARTHEDHRSPRVVELLSSSG